MAGSLLVITCRYTARHSGSVRAYSVTCHPKAPAHSGPRGSPAAHVRSACPGARLSTPGIHSAFTPRRGLSHSRQRVWRRRCRTRSTHHWSFGVARVSAPPLSAWCARGMRRSSRRANGRPRAATAERGVSARRARRVGGGAAAPARCRQQALATAAWRRMQCSPRALPRRLRAEAGRTRTRGTPSLSLSSPFGLGRCRARPRGTGAARAQREHVQHPDIYSSARPHERVHSSAMMCD
jgi:hypothetical protein